MSLASRELKTASDVYEWLVAHGGLEPVGRDASLLDGIRLRLGLDDTTGFPQCLENAEVSVERFVEVLFAVVAPYALMMGDLAEMFERHQVTAADGAGQPLRIRFDFSELGEELTFSLKHFRETLQRWVECRMQVTCWSTAALWRLYDIFRNHEHAAPTPVPSLPWAEKRITKWPTDLWRATEPPPPPPLVGVDGPQRLAQFVTDLVATLVARIAAEGPIESTVDHREPGISIPAPLAEWSPAAVRLIDNDLLTTNLIRALWGWLHEIAQMTDTDREDTVASVERDVKALVETLPTAEADVHVAAFEELLNLPVWKHRYALYSAWLLVIIERALSDYPLRLQPVDGTLSFRFKESKLGSLATKEGDLELLAEARRPLGATAAGKSRVSNIQPDYLICTASTADAAALVILEAKHYKRADSVGFRAALSDYAKSQPRALVLLANFGPVPATITDGLEREVARRAQALGDVHPANQPKVADLTRIIRSVLPDPSAPRSAVTAEVEMIIIDISGSMRAHLTAEGVRDALREIVASNPHAHLLAVDTAARQEWPEALSGLEELFALRCDAGTDIPAALVHLELQDAVVVTDDEGSTQLDRLHETPKLVGIVGGSTIRWSWTSSPS